MAAGIAANVSTALRVRFDAIGDRADIDRAVDLAQAAVADSAPDGSRRARYLSNLGSALATRATGNDYDQAVEVCRAAADLVDQVDPLRATVLGNLGTALRGRTDLAAAVEAFREGAGVPTAAPLARALCAMQWADTAVELGRDPAGALAGYRAALDLLWAVTDRRLPREDQQHRLSRLGGLASAAAAAALELDNPGLALALLEQGRGVLLAQALETRDDPTDLRVSHPDLADRYDDLRRKLNDPAWPNRRTLVRDWQDLLDEVRTREGFETFLRAPDPAALVATIGDRVLVAVNVSPMRCDAITVVDGTIRSVPLPDLTFDAAQRNAATFLAAVHGDDPDRDAVATTVLE